MMNDDINIWFGWWKSLDKTVLYSLFFLLVTGFIMMVSASPYVANRISIWQYHFVLNHFVYIVLSLCVMCFVSFLSTAYIKRMSIFLFVIFFILSLASFLFSGEIKGARRWIYIFGFSLQPSEFLKIFFVLVNAIIFDFLYRFSKNIQYLAIVCLYMMCVIVFLLQRDFGMTFLITIATGMQFFLMGIGLSIILLGVIFVTLLIFFAYSLIPHVRHRINEFFSDGYTYQAQMSIDAISNGGLLGRGPGNGVFKEKIPDVHTDFIFSAITEEFGLIFAMAIICVYIYIYYRMFFNLYQENSIFKLLASGGILALLMGQVFIHIASNLALIPTKGVTLPFVSYGGSSMLSWALAFGILFVFTKKQAN